MQVQSNKNQRVKKYYVYGHYTNKGELYYIGVGTILNLKTKKESSKYSRAYHLNNRNKFWTHVFNKHGLKIRILYEFYTKEESLLKEKELVEKYGRRILGKGLLTNISSGGEVGPIGRTFKMSKEQKEKLSKIKSHTFYVYNSQGIFLKEIKTHKKVAEFCGVTYNAIHSCLQTKNFTNGFFVFKEFKGLFLGYTESDLNFKSPLSKRIILKLNGVQQIFESIADAARFLETDRKNLKKALHSGRICKGYIVKFEGSISSQDPK